MDHRWLARGLVVALHVAVLLALWQHGPPRFDEPGERRVTTVRLIEPRRAAPPPREQQRTPATPRLPLPALPQAAVAPDTPRPDDAPPVATAPAAAPTPEPAGEPPRMTLRLTLPPGYAASANARRNPALDDPRSNTPKLSLEDRIADATGGAGAWVEEQTSENRAQSVGALGEYRTVMRRGNTCVEVFRSRISDTDPFNGNVAPRAGKMVGKPYKCR